MITVLSWLWRQIPHRYEYTAEDVNIWASMVRRNLTLEHRLACVTDCPEGVDSSIDIIPLPPDPGIRTERWSPLRGLPQCYRRLHMWSPDAARWYGERIVCMDLDCVVTGSLDPILSRQDDVVLLRGVHRKRPYNGSLMMLTAGARPQMWNRLSQEEAETASRSYWGSDQALLAHVLGSGEATWSEADGVYVYTVGQFPLPRRPVKRGEVIEAASRPTPEGMRLVVFPGDRKPSQLRESYSFIAEHYR